MIHRLLDLIRSICGAEADIGIAEHFNVIVVIPYCDNGMILHSAAPAKLCKG